MGYSNEEQELFLHYDVSIRGVLDADRFKVSVSKRPPKRELTEEQREALQARMAKMHAARSKPKEEVDE